MGRLRQAAFRLNGCAALNLLRNGKADLIMVHAPAAEKKAVAEGWAAQRTLIGSNEFFIVGPPALEDKFMADGYGVNRRDVMYNDFVIVGPPSDPAGVGKAKSAPEAFRAIAAKGSKFISRADESGTHVKEKEIWKAAGIVPRGAWYVEAGQGMGEVLTMATQLRGYTLSDRDDQPLFFIYSDGGGH